MIHEINEAFDNQYKNATPSDNDYVISIKDGRILYCDDNGQICFPKANVIEGIGHYLFSIDDESYYLAEVDEFDGYTYHEIYQLRTALPKKNAFAAVTAHHINSWYKDNQFCGRCGKKMEHSKTERAMKCECGNTVYPKICPAVIVAVKSNGKICMTKYREGYGNWALIAGFNEIGETIEQTVHREVMEEIGVKVKSLKYYKCQPWGFTSTLLFGFECEVDGDDTIKLDTDELKEGR